MHSALEELISISSAPLSDDTADITHMDLQLVRLLTLKNGFFAFEGCLEVFPLGLSSQSWHINHWNSEDCWISAFGHLRPKGTCFAQDIFGCQFFLNDKVYLFDPETAVTQVFAEDIERWSDKILSDYDLYTGYSIGSAWQKANSSLQARQRLMPKFPFVLGGLYEVSNLFAVDAASSMVRRADIARQVHELPDGSPITLMSIE